MHTWLPTHPLVHLPALFIQSLFAYLLGHSWVTLHTLTTPCASASACACVCSLHGLQPDGLHHIDQLRCHGLGLHLLSTGHMQQRPGLLRHRDYGHADLRQRRMEQCNCPVRLQQ